MSDESRFHEAIEEWLSSPRAQHGAGDAFRDGWDARGPEVRALEAEVARLRDEITGCSRHHAQPWQLPEWCTSRAAVEAATDEQLDDVMGTCHVEPGDSDACLACYAYEVLSTRG